MHAKEGTFGAFEEQKALAISRMLEEQTLAVTGEAADAPPYEPAAPQPTAEQLEHARMALYQATFEHVTTNRLQRRAREGLAKKAAIQAARKRAKKARRK